MKQIISTSFKIGIDDGTSEEMFFLNDHESNIRLGDIVSSDWKSKDNSFHDFRVITIRYDICNQTESLDEDTEVEVIRYTKIVHLTPVLG